MNILFKGVFGSRLYSTNNESSDYDYKGIFLVPIRDCILGGYSRNINIKTNTEKNVKNSAEDSDTELYALQEFIKLALQGQTVAIDMLSTPKDKTLISSPEWEILVANRKRFYTKRMSAFIGYSKSMQCKFTQRAEKLNVFRDTLKILEGIKTSFPLEANLWDIWNLLPEDNNRKKIEVDSNRSSKNRWVYEVNGKKLQSFASIDYAIEILKIQIEDYGKRVRQAAETNNIDKKSLHHAFRVALELKQILKEGDLVFPLPETQFLKQIKYGELDFFKDGLEVKFANLLDEIEYLIQKSSLPDKPDRDWANNFILSCYKIS